MDRAFWRQRGLMNPIWALFSLKGRLRRRGFWLWGIAIGSIYCGCIVDAGLSLPYLWPMKPGHGRAITLLVGLPIVLWMSFAFWTKRFHDLDRPMWDIVHVLFPIRGWIWGIFECASDGTRGINRFGPSPKVMSSPTDVF
jgi:uncharacterized membrane protein YhaH (DUF805 family)